MGVADFKIEAVSDGARAGTLTTRRGDIQTPVFMPVGTYGSVKGVTAEELKACGSQIILGNTFHLMLRPGVEVMDTFGGLHDFMHWPGPILTDSGGFQVFSLAANRKITEQGATFKSPINGSKVELTPESSMQVQKSLGSDIVMIFDECTPYPCEYKYAKASMHMTHRWLDRCLAQDKKSPFLYGYEQTLFPIVQGST